MALQKTTAYFPFAAGPDTKTDPKQVVPGKLLQLQNGYFQTPGMIRKRPGYPQIGTNGLSAGVGIATFKNELVSVSSSALSSFQPTLGQAVSRGAYTPLRVETWAASGGDRGEAAAHALGYVGYAYFSFALSASYWAIFDAATQTAITSITGNQLSGVGSSDPFKVFALGNYLVCIYTNSSGIFYQAVDVATSPTTFGSPVQIDTGLTGDPTFDGCVLGGTLYLAYGKGGVTLASLSPTLTLTTGAAIAGLGFRGVTVFGSSGNSELHIAGGDYISTLKVAVYKTDMTTQVLAPTTLATWGSSQDIALTGWTNPGLGSAWGNLLFEANGHVWLTGYNAGIPQAVNLLCGNAKLQSKVFDVGAVAGGGYVFVQNTSAFSQGIRQQPTNFLIPTVASTPGYVTPVLKLAPLNAGSGRTSSGWAPSEVTQNASGEFIFPYLQQTYPNQYALHVAQFSFSGAPQSAEIGSNLHLSGGILSMYDGQGVVEHGFHCYPEITSTSIDTASGSLAAGTYQWVVTFEWVDNQGQQHRSAPSAATELSPSGSPGNTVSITVGSLYFTAKGVSAGNVVNACLYRASAGGPYQLCAQSANVVTGDGTALTVDSVTLTDAGTNMGNSHPPDLYTTGGEVSNYGAPAVLSLTTYKNRLCALPADSRGEFWFSKQVLPGSPVEMSLFFTQAIDSKGGDGTALCAMDDKLIVFKKAAIFAIVGDGPSPNGSSNDFTSGQLIATDVGAVNATSVVLTPLGIMFQSAKGISLLDRSLSTSYIGAPVEATVQGQTVLSAVLCPALNHVRFMLSSGQTVVYDYLVGQWSVFTNPAGVQACLWNGLYTYVTSAGGILQETAGTFTDNGAFYALKIQTSWLSFAGIQGFQRVRDVLVLGDWKSAHTLEVQVAYDFVSTPSQTAQISASASVTPYQFRVLFDRQKCEAVSLTIQDSQTAPYGEGMDLSGLAFEVAVKRGPVRVSQSQTTR